MSSSRFILRIVIILGCAVLGASAGVFFQALRITGKPQQFRSMAKLVGGGNTDPVASRGAATWSEAQTDFYGTIIETIESADMKLRALERVRALHPELADSDVEIRAVRSQGSAIFSVLAVGSEPRYTKIFLDALLDEFIAFRQSIREQAQGKSLQVFLQSVVDAQKRMEETLEVMEKTRSKVESLPAASEQERRVARLASFRNQRDDLGMELKSSVAGLGQTSGTLVEAKAQLIDQEIQTLEAAVGAFEQEAAEFRIVSEKHAQAKQVYETMFGAVQRLQDSFNTSGDYVAIQERASPAAENVEDWQLPIAMGAGAGGFLGALVGFLISLALSGSPPAPYRQA